MSALLVLTNCPDAATAEHLARGLVEARLAACVNILPPSRSIYTWNGQIEDALEIPLLIKSTADNYAALEAHLQQHHPYDIPEIVALPITHGLPAYLDWLAMETRS